MFLLEGCKVVFVFKNKKHIAYYFRELLIVKYSSKPHPLIIYLIMYFNEDLEVKLQFCIKVFEFKKIPTYWLHCLLLIHFLFFFSICQKPETYV